MSAPTVENVILATTTTIIPLNTALFLSTGYPINETLWTLETL